MALPTERLKTLIEAALFVAGRPLNVSELKSSVLADYPVTSRYVQLLLAEIRQDYSTRGVELKEVASGWRFQARQEYAEELSRLWSERAPRYSRAVMETLTLIAYRQPITRAEIEAIRGVAVSSQIVNNLKERGWVRSIGHKEVAGRPELLATTREFLDYFNLQSLEQLPELDPDLQPPLSPMPMAEGGSDQQSGNPDE
ncbi:SMC-Scp complex subunit ScpB [Aeromonas sobria]|uniref:SMC-Scp complex subunit ScpB n=1 Tax=Aeromonas sobria TaxID=646 RepID=UPI0026F0F8E7|nr:SMC-Scp complex subunit ScpB [Aeromonas sobria]